MRKRRVKHEVLAPDVRVVGVSRVVPGQVIRGTVKSLDAQGYDIVVVLRGRVQCMKVGADLSIEWQPMPTQEPLERTFVWFVYADAKLTRIAKYVRSTKRLGLSV